MMRKLKDKKGFTLAELLIVIAIIAVLVGIMIPVFGGQLTKAKRAADFANVRAAYSEAVATAMLKDDYNAELAVLTVEIDEKVATNGSDVEEDNTNHLISVALGGKSQTFKVDENVIVTVKDR